MPILSWLTRDQDINTGKGVPYRLLEEATELSAGDLNSGNMLIQGDNLEALKALLPFYAGRVKCIYIDPPYNTRSAFEHYDDNLEHTKWLAMIWPRLELLRDLLAEDGSIWVSIDDNEGHYLKVIMDEVFGRKNFVAANVWQKRYSRENREVIGDVHEYILVYATSVEKFKARRNLVPLDEEQARIYRNPDNPGETDPTKRWRGLPMTAQGYWRQTAGGFGDDFQASRRHVKRLVVGHEAVEVKTFDETPHAGDVVTNILKSVAVDLRKHKWRQPPHGRESGVSGASWSITSTES